MQRGDYRVLLDACVLAPANLCDLLLRLAETPRLYTPLLSPEILTETVRTQKDALKWPDGLPQKWRSEVERYFPEAIVTGYEHFIPICENNPKDRHVLAAAVHGRADSIVTFNLKDFPAAAVSKFGIAVCHPADYLLALLFNRQRTGGDTTQRNRHSSRQVG